jgi:hypothetical protein
MTNHISFQKTNTAAVVGYSVFPSIFLLISDLIKYYFLVIVQPQPANHPLIAAPALHKLLLVLLLPHGQLIDIFGGQIIHTEHVVVVGVRDLHIEVLNALLVQTGVAL